MLSAALADRAEFIAIAALIGERGDAAADASGIFAKTHLMNDLVRRGRIRIDRRACDRAMIILPRLYQTCGARRR